MKKNNHSVLCSFGKELNSLYYGNFNVPVVTALSADKGNVHGIIKGGIYCDIRRSEKLRILACSFMNKLSGLIHFLLDFFSLHLIHVAVGEAMAVYFTAHIIGTLHDLCTVIIDILTDYEK